MTAAAIDIGTNSVRLLIVDDSGAELEREMHITRLGQDVDQTGRLAPEAIARTTSVLRHYAARLQARGAGALRVTATSAARDAENRADFFSEVQEAVGATPELLSGDEEAKLSFAGATAGSSLGAGAVAIFDIGGGSTEFALGHHEPEAFISLDIGGVRMTERFLTGDPPTKQELADCRAFVKQQLTRVSGTVPVASARHWIGLAGTVTSCAAFSLKLTSYDPTRTHGYRLTRKHATDFLGAMAATTISERRELLLEAKRADVIVGGAVVLDAIFETFELESIQVSEKDILDGLAASVV